VARITVESVARAGDRRRPLSGMMHWKIVLVALVFAQLVARVRERRYIPGRRGSEEHEHRDEYRR